MIDPAKAFRLDGKAALVTGGTRGIGRAIARGLRRRRRARCACSRASPTSSRRPRAALDALGAGATVYAGSAGDPEAIEGCVSHCVAELGGLDILVNNAGTNPTFGPMIETEPRAVRKVLEVNLEGPLLLTQAAWRSWMRDHGGRGRSTSPRSGGIRPSLFIGMYNMSKAALLHMTRQLAVELAPGRAGEHARARAREDATSRSALFEHDEEGTAARFPMKRLGVPDDLAGAALFLASEASSWMTGDTIVVDGGALVGGP